MISFFGICKEIILLWEVHKYAFNEFASEKYDINIQEKR